MNVFLWILQVLLGLMFLLVGSVKASQPLEAVRKRMAWANAVPDGLVRFIGVAELLGSIGLILPAATNIAPALTIAAAVGIALIMLLAAGFHLSRREPSNAATNVVLLLLALVIVVGRIAWAKF
jgi:putative oxidoreductase